MKRMIKQISCLMIGTTLTTFTTAQNNAIFKGGIADGWNSRNIVQASASIYKGGSGDGWASQNVTQSSTSIFKGGIGDGWASNYRPQGPLPVTLLYFTANKLNETAAVLKWETSQEINSSYFEVQRSTDALVFTTIGKMASSGNSALPIEYSFTDYKPLVAVNYYRLKQVDIDGKSVYTPTRVVHFEIVNAGQLKYYPNPTNGLVNIKITEQIRQEAKVINISNALGVVVDQIKINANSNSLLNIDLSRFAKGVYFIQVKTANINSTQRIVLQ